MVAFFAMVSKTSNCVWVTVKIVVWRKKDTPGREGKSSHSRPARQSSWKVVVTAITPSFLPFFSQMAGASAFSKLSPMPQKGTLACSRIRQVEARPPYE